MISEYLKHRLVSLVRDPNENAEKSDHNVTPVPLKTCHANIRLHDPAPLFL